MQNRSLASNLGIYAFAASAIVLGLLGLASGNFATQWQHVGPDVPFREPLACSFNRPVSPAILIRPCPIPKRGTSGGTSGTSGRRPPGTSGVRPGSVPVIRRAIGSEVGGVVVGILFTTAPRSCNRVRAYRAAVNFGSVCRASVMACLRSAQARITFEM